MPPISLVILSYNRRPQLRQTLRAALALPERPPIIVVDNASPDAAGAAVAAEFPQVETVQLPRNLGAAARNYGAQAARTPYLAFSDDDTEWAAGSVARAAELLARYPQVAVLSGRVVVGQARREDPVCRVMARSPLPSEGLPGPRLVGFLAGASAVRRDAFVRAGGYEPRLFIGGEEELLALDLMAAGGSLAYAPELTIHHRPSAVRDSARRRALLLRNRLWTALLRRSPRHVMATLERSHREAAGDPLLRSALDEALRGLPWVLRRRRAVPAQVEAWCRQVEGANVGGLGDLSLEPVSDG